MADVFGVGSVGSDPMPADTGSWAADAHAEAITVAATITQCSTVLDRNIRLDLWRDPDKSQSAIQRGTHPAGLF
jgi:hypothetical protein